VITGGVCCERCPDATPDDLALFARRRILKAAVFTPGLAGPRPGRQSRVPPPLPAQDHLAERGRYRDSPAHLYRAVTGHVLDVSAHFVTIGRAGREQRFALTADSTAWRGWPLDPSAVRPGDEVVIRLVPSRPGVADRIWSNIGRVCGTIVERDSGSLLVAEGATRTLQVVVISDRASAKIRVRFPNLRPGYLIDIIGQRRGDVLEGTVPATYQPPYLASRVVPAAPPPAGRLAESITGSAVWHEPADEPYGVLGLGYPAVDPSAGCAEDMAAAMVPGRPAGYRQLPYLAVGTSLRVRNECSHLSWTLPVTSCAPVARLFNDHCATCRTSPRGRVADLTLASFVALGGELQAGCFNATLTIGR
jgi:hypothetical protein